MSVSVQLGLLLALLTAFGSVAGFLYKFRGARAAPAVELRRPLRSSVELFRSPMYALGILIALGSWGLHVGALALAPISLVQSVIAGGLVLLTVVADRLFGIEVTRREWVGVGLTAAGLAFLAATLDRTGNGAHSQYEPRTLAIYVGAVAAAGLLLAAVSKRATVLAVAAGLLWAASDTSIKALSSHLGHLGAGVLFHPLASVILIASLIGLLVSARSLQLGEAVPVIALTSAAANLTTIAAGPIVFGEPLPPGKLGLVRPDPRICPGDCGGCPDATAAARGGAHISTRERLESRAMFILIVGSGRVGSAVAKRALAAGHEVSVMDSDPLSHERLDKDQTTTWEDSGGRFTVGTALEIDGLIEAGIEEADIFLAATRGDNTNLVIAQIAQRRFKVPRVVVRVADPGRAAWYAEQGLLTICPTQIAIDQAERLVLAP